MTASLQDLAIDGPSPEGFGAVAHLPAMTLLPSGAVPRAPKSIAETGLDASVLGGIALKLASSVPNLTTPWAAERMCLPADVVDAIMWQLKQDQFIEILGESAEAGYRYAVTDRGRDYARRLMEISGYIGPAPVALEAYTAMLDWQSRRWPKPRAEDVRQAVAPLVLPSEAVEVAALAALSGRSLLLYGPSGNGKTTLGHLLHDALQGELWIPHAIAVESSVIRIFDMQIHQEIEVSREEVSQVDRRWVRVRRPLVVAGGEMTIEQLDLAYSPALRYYEAPPHVKANGGTFLIDDFGRQRVAPHEMLNRWIIPLERSVDYLTLCTGQKIQVPFRLMLIVATNLDVASIIDPAFLRRMGYRLMLEKPTAEAYEAIFRRYAQMVGVEVPSSLLPALRRRYDAEHRELRASEPRDLIERAHEICLFHRRPFALDPDVMNLAWTAYFGLTSP